MPQRAHGTPISIATSQLLTPQLVPTTTATTAAAARLHYREAPPAQGQMEHVLRVLDPPHPRFPGFILLLTYQFPLFACCGACVPHFIVAVPWLPLLILQA